MLQCLNWEIKTDIPPNLFVDTAELILHGYLNFPKTTNIYLMFEINKYKFKHKENKGQIMKSLYVQFSLCLLWSRC